MLRFVLPCATGANCEIVTQKSHQVLLIPRTSLRSSRWCGTPPPPRGTTACVPRASYHTPPQIVYQGYTLAIRIPSVCLFLDV